MCKNMITAMYTRGRGGGPPYRGGMSSRGHGMNARSNTHARDTDIENWYSYQGGYGDGPLGGLRRSPHNPLDAEMEQMQRQQEALREQQIMLENQQRQLDLQRRQLQEKTYNPMSQGSHGFKRPAFPPPLMGPPMSKRFHGPPPGAGPAIRPLFGAGPPKVPPLMPQRPAQKMGSINRTLHIFRGEHLISRTVKVRIDQAVGNVAREMKEDLLGPPKSYNLAGVEFKRLKERIRQRLHTLLMDKAVGSADELHRMYRAAHKRTQDESFLLEVKKSMDGDTTIKYIKGNLHTALYAKLDDIFAKLYRLYEEESKNATDKEGTVESTEMAQTSEEKDTSNGEDVEMVEVKEEPKATERVVKQSAVGVEEEDLEYYREKLNELLMEQLPKILPQFKNCLISIICQDQQFMLKSDKEGDANSQEQTAEPSSENNEQSE